MNESLSTARWDDLAARLDLPLQAQTFALLEQRHAERTRRYHTARHVNECLAALDLSQHEQATNPLVEFALWFHDAIYSTFSGRNELRSAGWAEAALRRAGGLRRQCDEVFALVMATASDAEPADAAQELIGDVDRAILGTDPERYREYELQLRAEYWWVPTPLYRRQRSAQLNHLLSRPTVFVSGEFRDRYESAAQRNLCGGIDQLASLTGTFRWRQRV